MTEPIARYLKKYVNKVYLATKVEKANLLFNTYDKIYTFSDIDHGKIESDLIIKLSYESSTNKRTYLDGYMESVGFGDKRISEIPILKKEWKDIIKEEYILLCPHTSQWESKKRTWKYYNYLALSRVLERDFKLKCIMLKPSHTFKEMLSLVSNCKLFIGNDSGPAIIAQSFGKRTFIIFGATRPFYVCMSKLVVPIYDKDRHKLCNHTFREEEVNCCEEFCMERISIDNVLNQIKMHL